MKLDGAQLEISHPDAITEHEYFAFDGLIAAVVNITETLGRLINGVDAQHSCQLTRISYATSFGDFSLLIRLTAPKAIVLYVSTCPPDCPAIACILAIRDHLLGSCLVPDP